MTIILHTGSGWFNKVKQVPSPNYEKRSAGQVISLLVIHNISLPPGEFGTDGIDQLFTNTLDPNEHPYYADICHLRVAAHVCIKRDGLITQYVSLLDKAFHAGKSSFSGVEGCNDYSIGIELEGTDHTPFTPLQYESLVLLTKLIREAFPAITLDRITGHSNIAPDRKTDPGPFFDWSWYKQQLCM